MRHVRRTFAQWARLYLIARERGHDGFANRVRAKLRGCPHDLEATVALQMNLEDLDVIEALETRDANTPQ